MMAGIIRMISDIESLDIIETLPEKSRSTSTGTVTFGELKQVSDDSVVEVDDFDDADFLSGRFVPEGSDDENVEFQIWLRSGLVYIEADTSRLSEAIKAIDEALGEGYQVHRYFVPYREQVWEFVNKADRRDVRTVTPTGNVISFDHDELVDSSAEQYPIVSAELEFDFDDNRVGVVFEGDTLSIDSPTDHVNSRVLENFDWAFATEFGNEY